MDIDGNNTLQTPGAERVSDVPRKLGAIAYVLSPQMPESLLKPAEGEGNFLPENPFIRCPLTGTVPLNKGVYHDVRRHYPLDLAT